MYKSIRFVSLLFLILAATTANAQYRQDRSEFEYMFKAEAGYMPFVANLGSEGENGYYISDQRHMVNVNVINGVNFRQDFFVGLGLGYGYAAKPGNFSEGWHTAMGFVDVDYRPLREEFAPMVGAKLGASYMMSDTPYENTLTPYLELSTGINWFFRFGYRNMERNYLSLYLELAVAYTQQTVFIPVRMGFRF